MSVVKGLIYSQLLMSKHLGTTLDQSLSGEAMACSIIKKANAGLKFPYRKRDYLISHFTL
jgi:hypothetical protein